ncbi:MAG: bifunctional hydroxymethylpyrimidine kinase/phosphomethylpyrimidine kinase [Planctomycetes bacterium]|nr:bifunctional hydroxymethylpyrimidine kinase/phosphomethylpyrimidine kinase [Planctomycetota bacterium]
MRVDREVSGAIYKDAAEALLSALSKHMETLDAIVISDYAKGVISKHILSPVLDMAKKHNRPVIGDMKPQHVPLCTNITLLTSNCKEVSKAAGIANLIKAGKSICSSLSCHLLVTRGEEGMSLFEKESVHHFPTYAKDIYDVAGAGDTVTATMALALSAGIPLPEAAEIANHAAGVVVGKSGVATVTPHELEHSLKNNAQKN